MATYNFRMVFAVNMLDGIGILEFVKSFNTYKIPEIQRV